MRPTERQYVYVFFSDLWSDCLSMPLISSSILRAASTYILCLTTYLSIDVRVLIAPLRSSSLYVQCSSYTQGSCMSASTNGLPLLLFHSNVDLGLHATTAYFCVAAIAQI